MQYTYGKDSANTVVEGSPNVDDDFKEAAAILHQQKSPFWSLGGRRRDDSDESTAGTAPEVSSKLGNLMQQLDAGIEQSIQRERGVQAGRKRELHVVETSAPEAAAPQPEPQEAAAPKVEQGTIEAEPAQAEAVEIDDATSEALRAIEDQRKAAEALLLETRALEERIKTAAVAAQATRAYEAAIKKAEASEEKAKTIALAEAEAQQRAEASLRDHALLANELKSIQDQVAAKRSAADAAKAQIAELERQLGAAQQAAQTILADLALHESRARECSVREGAAARSAAESAARAVARKTEREAVEAAAQAARERAQILKTQLPAAREDGALEDVARLAERIAQQAQLARTLKAS